MDVLAYSAFNRQKQLNQEIANKRSCLESLNPSVETQRTVCWLKCIEPCLLREPHHTEYWNLIPDLTGPNTQGFKVCDTGNLNYFTCGACCCWVVPAGVTRARFQIWGAGGGSGSKTSCNPNYGASSTGAGLFGGTGAYASVIIPVTAGCVYTLCAGCAHCCMSTGGGCAYPGCASFVSGAGLCNFCAEGGYTTSSDLMARYGSCDICYLSGRGCSGGGFTCGGAAVGYILSGCNTGGIVPYVPGALYFGTTTCPTSVSSPSIVYGISGMFPKIGSICTGSNICGVYGCQVHPPIYGYEFESQCEANLNTNTLPGGGFCGDRFFGCSNCATNGPLRIPSAGGYGSWGWGCCFPGDRGRMGMVCVTFC